MIIITAVLIAAKIAFTGFCIVTVAKRKERRARAEREEAAFRSLTQDSLLAEWFEYLEPTRPEALRAAAREAILARPRLDYELAELVLANDVTVARKAMEFVGELHAPAADVVDAIRIRARQVVQSAELIDPRSPDARTRLYAKARPIVAGLGKAATGLRRAGIDLRPELRAISKAAYPVEQAEPRDIAAGCAQLVAIFDRMDVESARAAH